jgi:hypothetical protein
LNVKKLLLLALLLAGVAPATHAQVFGQYTPAGILPVNSHLGGAYVDFSENAVGLMAQLRLSFYPNVDFGFQGGLSRLDLGSTTKTSLRLATDVRFGVAQASAGRPLDIAAGAGLGVETGDNYTLLRLGPSAVASHTFTFSNNSSCAPYVGLMLLFSSQSHGGESTTDFSLPVRLGAELKAIPGVSLTAELQLRIADDFYDHTGFSAGVNLPF